MKKFIATLLITFANWVLRRDPYKNRDLQRLREIGCAESGHLWTKYKDPDKPIKERTYCRRCGQMYHEHEYIGTID